MGRCDRCFLSSLLMTLSPRWAPPVSVQPAKEAGADVAWRSGGKLCRFGKIPTCTCPHSGTVRADCVSVTSEHENPSEHEHGIAAHRIAQHVWHPPRTGKIAADSLPKRKHRHTEE